MLLHYCKDFPYISRHEVRTDGAHAVLLTGVDTDNGIVYFNNPRGDKDQSAYMNVILAHIAANAYEGRTFGFFGK